FHLRAPHAQVQKTPSALSGTMVYPARMLMRRTLNATTKTNPAFWLGLLALAVILILTLARGVIRAGMTRAEASAGFDNTTIETAADPQNQRHSKDRAIFDEVEAVTPDGLGPVYNAQSCREC